jgi:hypothetical protein
LSQHGSTTTLFCMASHFFEATSHTKQGDCAAIIIATL